jgi:hypothetical protein
MRVTLRIIASILIGLVLLIPLSAFYDKAGLPVYHSWGLIHGTFATALPALVAAGFVSLGLIPWFGPAIDPIPRVVASLSVFPLQTLLFWAQIYSSNPIFSVSHAAVYGGLFGLLTLLCIMSKRPVLVPFFLIIPILIDSTFGFFPGLNELSGLEIFALDLLVTVLPVLVVSGAALALAQKFRAHKDKE